VLQRRCVDDDVGTLDGAAQAFLVADVTDEEALTTFMAGWNARSIAP